MRPIGVLVLALAVSLPARAQPAPTILPLIVHVAAVDGEPVAPAGFIDARVERANQIFAAYAVGFAIVERRPLGAVHAQQRSRSDRDALAPYVRGGAIHCFVVASLEDVDEPGRMRRGVHWHARARPATRYVILSAIAGPNVLAHELGHYLGNREHSLEHGNLMSYDHGEELPILDAAQQGRLARMLRGALARGELSRIPNVRE